MTGEDVWAEIANRIANLRALHIAGEHGPSVEGWCVGCDDFWPCATIRILDGEL